MIRHVGLRFTALSYNRPDGSYISPNNTLTTSNILKSQKKRNSFKTIKDVLLIILSKNLFLRSCIVKREYRHIGSIKKKVIEFWSGLALPILGTLRFIGRQRDENGKKTLYDMCL